VREFAAVAMADVQSDVPVVEFQHVPDVQRRAVE
jgi:hypothetical protein